MKLPLTGRCQCAAVRYAIDAEPLTLYACHCTDCQKQSASAFALSLVVPRASVRITEGAPREWVRRNEAGRTSSCWLCQTCGARLYHEPHGRPEITIVKPGTLEDTRWLDPVGHIWTRSAQPWVDLGNDLVLYEAQPPDLSRLIEAWRGRPAS
jgi:hypothetical protein